MSGAANDGTASGSVRATSAAAALCLLGDSALYAVLPAEAVRLGLTPLEVGVLLGANRIVRLALNGPTGRLVERVGPRGPLVLAVALAAATTACYGLFARTFAALLAARLAWGLAWSIVRLAAYLAVHEGPAERRGALMQTVNAIARTGSLVAVVAGGVLVDRVGFPEAFYVLAAGTLLALPAASAAFPRPRPSPRVAGGGGTPPSPGSREMALLLAIFLVNVTGAGLLTVSAGKRIVELAAFALAHGEKPALDVATLAGIALAGRWGASIGFGLVAGALADRFGRRAVALASGAASAILLLVLARALRVEGFVGAAVAAFVALAGLQAALDALAQDVAAGAASPTAALQRYADSQDVGSALGALSLGLVDPSVRLPLDLPYLYLASAGAVALATVAALLVARRVGPPPGAAPVA